MAKQKKQKKDARKEIDDLFVQGTNDNSIISKRSVERLYAGPLNPNPDQPAKEYFKYFVKKSPRRSPAINRGYWIRMNAIRTGIERIMRKQHSQSIVIINLGCGFDPLPFQLLDSITDLNSNSIFCVDIDYPDLMANKVEMIKRTKELCNIINFNSEEPFTSSIEDVKLKTNNYAAVGCDLNNLELFRDQMTALGLYKANTTSIFISEVALAYMSPQSANPIIAEASKFPSSHFIILEQILPSGKDHPFGRKMLKHFHKMEAPLLCVQDYPTIVDQEARFKELGYRTAEARTLFDCWNSLPPEIRSKIQKVEAFDEWEEFVLFGQHYFCLHATNTDIQIYSNKRVGNETIVKQNLNFNLKIHQNDSYEVSKRKFASGCTVDDRFIMTFGSSQSRLNTCVSFSDGPLELQINDNWKPASRLCHGCICIGGSLYIFGGRTAPGRPMKDLWKLSPNSESDFSWFQLSDMPVSRSKHSYVKISDSEVLVFGGLSASEDPCFTFAVYFSESDSWKSMKQVGDVILSSMNSSNLVYDESSNSGTIIGGMHERDGNTISDTVYKFSIDLNKNEIIITKCFSNPLCERYGSKSILLNNDYILIIGGVSENRVFGKDDSIILIPQNSDGVQCVPFTSETWGKSPIFVGFELFSHNNSIWVVGGGAVCYLFGSQWNELMSITLGSDKTPENLVCTLETSTS